MWSSTELGYVPNCKPQDCPSVLSAGLPVCYFPACMRPPSCVPLSRDLNILVWLVKWNGPLVPRLSDTTDGNVPIATPRFSLCMCVCLCVCVCVCVEVLTVAYDCLTRIHWRWMTTRPPKYNQHPPSPINLLISKSRLSLQLQHPRMHKRPPPPVGFTFYRLQV
jgi:hypothetical protein